MHITPAWCEEQFGTQLRAFAADLHSHPELSFEETRTTQKILQALQSLPGVEVLATGAKTGAVARLAGGEGPAVALRADIDAIPQHEAVQRPDASVYEGKMHACGHDTHTASLLGAAMALCRRKSALRGDVYFVFQPAEEALSGAKYLVEQCGLFQAIHPAAMFGLHNYPELPLGTVGVKQGQLMSYKDVFEMRFVGRSGHSSMPQKNIDPIVAAAAFIQSVQTITSRNVGPLEAAVVSICQVHAGTPRNLVVDDVLLSGNIRTLDEAVRARVLQRFEQIARGTADAYECQLKLDMHPIVPGVNNPHDMYEIALSAAKASLGEEAIAVPPVNLASEDFFLRGHFPGNPIVPGVNNPAGLYRIALAAAEASLGKEAVAQPPVNLASEDFSIYGQHVPAFFYFLGSGAPGRPLYSWHNAHFYPDERTPVYGAALLAQSVLSAQAAL